MKAILLACAMVGASARGQAQDAAGMALQQASQQMQQVQQMAQQQASESNQSAVSPEQCAMSSPPGHLPAMHSASSFMEYDRFAVRQMQSLTAPLQTSLNVLNIPLWSTWRVVPWSDQMGFSVKPGVVKAGTKVRIRWRAGQNEVAVYYTTDGWSPNPSSIPYTGPITITRPTHLQVIQLGWKAGPGGCVMRTRSVIQDAYYDVAPGTLPPENHAVATDGLLRQGTKLRLVTGAAVDSSSAKPGDKVSLLLDQDVTVGGRVVIPKGTPVDAVLAEAISPQASPTAGMLVVAVRSLHEAGSSVGLHGVETLEGHPGTTAKEAVIEPGMSLQAIVTADVKLTP